MKDGTIGLDKAKGFIGWCIKRITGKPYGHAKAYLWGLTWESTVWWSIYWFKSGIRVTFGETTSDEYWQPKPAETVSQVRAEIKYFLEQLNTRRPYNIFKLLVLAYVIPHRAFFEKIHWIPFDNANMGEVCSTTVDEAKKAAGIDLLVDRMEGYTAPGDFRDSPLLEQVV